MGLLALCVAGSGWGQAPDSAARWAGDMAAWAKARLAADAGRLWGMRLDSVPWLFIAGPATERDCGSVRLARAGASWVATPPPPP